MPILALSFNAGSCGDDKDGTRDLTGHPVRRNILNTMLAIEQKYDSFPDVVGIQEVGTYTYQLAPRFEKPLASDEQVFVADPDDPTGMVLISSQMQMLDQRLVDQGSDDSNRNNSNQDNTIYDEEEQYYGDNGEDSFDNDQLHGAQLQPRMFGGASTEEGAVYLDGILDGSQ